MQMQKKTTRKEDGRFLVYYHFPDTATPEETAVFDAIEGIEDESPQTAESNPQSTIVNRQSEAAHV